MDNTKVQQFAGRLVAGPAEGADAEEFVRAAVAQAEDILAPDDNLAGPAGHARFNAVMARLQSTQFIRPTQTRVPIDRVGGAAGESVRERHEAEVQAALAHEDQSSYVGG